MDGVRLVFQSMTTFPRGTVAGVASSAWVGAFDLSEGRVVWAAAGDDPAAILAEAVYEWPGAPVCTLDGMGHEFREAWATWDRKQRELSQSRTDGEHT